MKDDAMTIACSTSAFKLPLPAALGEVARLGFRHVDPIAIKGWDHIDTTALAADFDAVAARIQRLLAEHRLTPVALNLAVGHLHDRSDAKANAQRLAEVCAAARLMKRLGIKVASFYPGYRADHRNWDDVLREEATTVREMLAIGQEAGVTFAVELHFATPFETIEQGLRLLDAVPELRIAYDPSHYAMQRIDLRRTEAFFDRIAHVHLRDAGPDKMQERFGAGTVDFDWILDTLAAHGYRGNCSIEYLPDLPGGSEPSILELRRKVEQRMQRRS